MGFIEFRHQVAIVGRVTDAQTGQNLGGARILVTDAPATFVNKLVVAAKLVKVHTPELVTAQSTLNNPASTTAQLLQAVRTILYSAQVRRVLKQTHADRTTTSPDGIFYFVDLPDGNYTLEASLPNGRSRYGTDTTTVAVTSVNGDITRVSADLAIPATTIVGQIIGNTPNAGGNQPVVMATVKLKGNMQSTFSDNSGNYQLVAVERGAFQVMVSARGYVTQEKSVTLNHAGDTQTVNFTLVLPP